MESDNLLEILNYYTPHKLRGTVYFSNEIMYVNSIYFRPFDNDPKKIEKPISGSGVGGLMQSSIDHFKPILRPLKDFVNNPMKWEDLYDEFSEYDFEIFINHFFVLGRSLNCMDCISFNMFQKFLKYHFDIFGLIDLNLAIDSNKYDNQPSYKNENN